MRPSEENNLSMIPGHLIRRDTPCSRPMTAYGPSAKFLARAKKRLVIGVLQTRFSHLELFAF